MEGEGGVEGEVEGGVEGEVEEEMDAFATATLRRRIEEPTLRLSQA